MIVTVKPKNLIGEITAPSSKSYAHRWIISACLSGKKCTVKNIGKNKDVLRTVDCMQKLGANCEIIGNDLFVYSFEKKESAVLDCGESGSTLRFLLPVSAGLGVKAKFIGSKKLLSRPCEELIKVLNEHGAKIQNFQVEGKLSCGEYEINPSVSSQYVTGLMFALPLIKGQSKIVFKGNLVSKDYVKITEDVLKKSNIKLLKTKNGYITEKSVFDIGDCVTVEGDYSGSAFFLSAGAIGGNVVIKGLNADSFQGDKKIIDVLRSFGAIVSVSKEAITVKAGELKGIETDCEDVPDIVQIISVVSAFAKGKTVLKNVSRLKYKESDRIEGIIKTLSTAKIKAEYNGKDLTVYGGDVYGGEFYSDNDHRTAMSQMILSSYAKTNSKITGAEAIEKSYPDFIKDFNKLQGETDVLF